MVLEFKNFKKKNKNKPDLELDLKIDDGSTLLIVGNDKDDIDFIRNAFFKKVKYKGEILFDNEKVSKQDLISANDFGFYPHLTVQKNLQRLLKIFDVDLSQDDIVAKIEEIDLDAKAKYKNLLENERVKLHILFLILLEQGLIVLDNTDKSLTNADKEVLKQLVLEKSKGTSVVIFDISLNKNNDVAEDVVVISDGEKSYFGKLADLLVIKQLVALRLSHKDSLDIILKDYTYTDYNDEEIVVREDMLEKVVYELLKNGIEVHQMRNLGEKIKLYSKEGE